MKDQRLASAKRRSILGYLRSKGYSPTKKGKGYLMMSPFKEERNPSFFIYENQGKFIDYSTGEMGDIIDLVMLLEKIPLQKAIDSILSDDGLVNIKIKKAPKPRRLNLKPYFQKDGKEVRRIHKYAIIRGIKRNNYYAGSVPMWDDKADGMVNKSAMLFPHRDEMGMIIGFKARIVFTDEDRFTARGRLGFYQLKTSNGFGKERLYVVESETSANSLCNFLEEINVNATVLCFGGVNQAHQIKIPDKFCNLFPRFLVIDYDGDEELYQERLKKFEHLNLRDVKIKVEKGEDINSLYMKRMISKYTHQILGNE